MQFHVTGALPNVQPHFFGVILRRPLSKVGPNFAKNLFYIIPQQSKNQVLGYWSKCPC